MERYTIELGQRLGRRVIADDPSNVTLQFTRLLPVQQVSKTVVIRRNQNRNLRPIGSQRQVVADLELFDQRLEVVLEVGDRNIEPVQIPLNPGQEQVATAVQVVIAVQDAAIVSNQELTNRRDGAFSCEAPGSAQKQDGGVHCRQIIPHSAPSDQPLQPIHHFKP